MATLTVSAGFRGWASHHTQTGCQSPPPAQSLGTPAVSGCAPPPRSPRCSWRSWDSRRGSRGSLSSRWGCVGCSCSSELWTGEKRGDSVRAGSPLPPQKTHPTTKHRHRSKRRTDHPLRSQLYCHHRHYFPFIRPVSASVTASNMQMRRGLTQRTTDWRSGRTTSRLSIFLICHFKSTNVDILPPEVTSYRSSLCQLRTPKLDD